MNKAIVILFFIGVAACETGSQATGATAAIVDDPPTTELFPKQIRLDGARDYQSIVVQQKSANGLTSDLTQETSFEITDPSVAKIAGTTVYPVGDGTTTLVAKINDRIMNIPVSVQDADNDTDLSFRLDVMPVLSKSGCNAGRCHGAARGQDGFNLSLYGFDPAGDHHRLTSEIFGRRTNVARPEASLLLTKAIGQAPHTGGQLMSTDDANYLTLLRWITEGAKNDNISDIAELVGINIMPSDAVLNGKNESQQLLVVAQYSDGTTRDVTALSTFISNNDNSAKVDSNGLVTAANRGEAFIMARFGTFTEGIHTITLPRDQEYSFGGVPEYNFVDTLVHNKLKKLRIIPSEVCSDEHFIRRVYLDLVGVTPSRQEFEAFVADTDPAKRSKIVDQLLQREEFVDLWAMKFGEILGIRTDNQVSYKALLGFHNWIRERLANETPLNLLSQEIISAEGGTFDNPPTNYFQIEANNRQLAENVAQSFLGIRLQCAQCHNHPFDRWTMDDYYGFNAFFSQVGFKQSRDPREFIVYSSGKGEVRHIVDERIVSPKFLAGDKPGLENQSRREVLAAWIAKDEQMNLARHLANVVWEHHFGRGIIDPVDDVRVSNPPANAELLDELARRFKGYNYTLKSLVRDICLSRTYQLSTQSNETNRHDYQNFSKAAVRRVRAEVLLDSISKITNTKDRFARMPADARSIEIADGAMSNYFLSTFGRAPRETVCSCEVDVQPNLSQAFHLLNGDTVNKKIVEGALVKNMIEQGKTPSEIIEQLYILCYCRKPSEKELDGLLASIDKDLDDVDQLNDIFWALLNSKEFLFNH